MSTDFSRFAILAAPVADAPIPPELITGLELARKRGPLGPDECRPIGSVPAGYSLAATLAALRAKLKPTGLDVTPSMMGNGLLVHRARMTMTGLS